MDFLYLDHNSTTPLLPEVADSMSECQAAIYGNPASQHLAGRRARQMLEDAREAIGRMLGADVDSRQPDQVIFTSGGTEANNLALLGLSDCMQGAAPGEAVISAIEHPSVAGPAEYLERLGWRIHRLRVSRDGVADVGHLAELLNAHTRFVSVMLGNNETGALQPVEEVARLCLAAAVPLHTDAVQVVGKLPVGFRARVSALSAAAHKFHGPKGVGVLVVRHGVNLSPILFGGFQQSGLRPGTENVALAVGMRRALELATHEGEARVSRMHELRNRLEAAIKNGCTQVVVNAAGAPRLPHTSNLSFRGLDRRAMLMALDLAGIACSSGSACASGSSEPSPVLLAMGCDKETVDGSLRFSLGATTTPDEVDEAVRRILSVCDRLTRSAESSRAEVVGAG